MTDDEVKRMLERIRGTGQYEYVARSYDATFRRAERIQEEDRERNWIQRAFMECPEDEEENDRHPRSYFRTRRGDRLPQTTGYAPTYYEFSNGSRVYGWVQKQNSRQGITDLTSGDATQQKPKEPELQAGDSAALDDFLGGFASA